MKNPMKLGFAILAIVLVAIVVMRFVSFLISVAAPIAVIAGIGLLAYGLFAKKSLGGGRGRLP